MIKKISNLILHSLLYINFSAHATEIEERQNKVSIKKIKNLNSQNNINRLINKKEKIKYSEVKRKKRRSKNKSKAINYNIIGINVGYIYDPLSFSFVNTDGENPNTEIQVKGLTTGLFISRKINQKHALFFTFKREVETGTSGIIIDVEDDNPVSAGGQVDTGDDTEAFEMSMMVYNLSLGYEVKLNFGKNAGLELGVLGAYQTKIITKIDKIQESDNESILWDSTQEDKEKVTLYEEISESIRPGGRLGFFYEKKSLYLSLGCIFRYTEGTYTAKNENADNNSPSLASTITFSEKYNILGELRLGWSF